MLCMPAIRSQGSHQSVGESVVRHESEVAVVACVKLAVGLTTACTCLQ